MSRREKSPAADQLLHISYTPVNVLCASEQTQGMSMWWQACPGRFLAMLLKIQHHLIIPELCLLLLFTYLRVWTGYFKHPKNVPPGWKLVYIIAHPPHLHPFPSKTLTYAAVVAHSPHQGGLTYDGQISRWRWADGARERAGRMSCLASWSQVSVTQSQQNHREFSECVLWVLEQL